MPGFNINSFPSFKKKAFGVLHYNPMFEKGMHIEHRAQVCEQRILKKVCEIVKFCVQIILQRGSPWHRAVR